jgi:hypothetical protein
VNGGAGNATGMVYTAVGRYSRFATTIHFYVYINVTKNGNLASNPYVDLPPFPPNYTVGGVGFYRQVNDTTLTGTNATTGYARAGDTKIYIFPSQNTQYGFGTTLTSGPVIISRIFPPYEFSLSGVYEPG